MNPKEVPSLLRSVVLILLVVSLFLSVHASPVNNSIEIDFQTNQPGREEVNVLQTASGLISFRRNLEAVYISQTKQIPLSNPFPFMTFAPVGELDNYREEGFLFHIRFSTDGQNWDSWEEIHLFHEIKPDDPRYIGEMQYVDTTMRFFEFMLTFNNDAITLPPVRLKKLRLDFFDPNVNRPPGLDAPYKGEESEMLTFMEEECDCSQPGFSDRVAWNCPDGNEFSGSGSPVFTDVTHMIIHHSAGSNSSSNWSASVLAIWNFHKNTNGWDDIGYNWLIDPNGVIYEGRGGGNNVRGAHFCGRNTNTMGVCLLGDFDAATPSNAALRSLENLLTWKSCDSGLDPIANTLHAPSNARLPVISGHQDGCNTLCPGANLFSLIASRIRNKVDSSLAACTTVTSIDKIAEISDLDVFPNPAQGLLNISFYSEASSEISLEVINFQGQGFLRKKLNLFVGKQELQLELPNLSAGLYLLRFSGKKGTLTRKILLR
ncbi:MAG: N-acetylmuramoyl-L-alanine amidase [Bacteroidota bacterium]